jgi:hypothetical protein
MDDNNQLVSRSLEDNKFTNVHSNSGKKVADAALLRRE